MIAALCSVPARAIFGLGDIVFDPSNFEEAIQTVIQLEQQYAQLVQTYRIVESQYSQMLRMAQHVPVNMVERYRVLATPWTQARAANRYGTSAAWAAGMNNGQDVATAYAGATESLGTYGGGLANLSADEQDRVKKSYATVEITDGANLAGMQTIGQLRGNSQAVETAIANLESD